MKDYTLQNVSELTGVERGFLQELAELYADPKRKVMSLWTMGFTSMCAAYGQPAPLQSAPVDRKDLRTRQFPVLADRQPSACGTAREVGTFAIACLPTWSSPIRNTQARRRNLRVPHGIIPEKPGYHAVEQDRMLRDGKLNFYWIQVNNNLQAAPNNSRGDLSRFRNPDNFIVVSDAYPTVTAMAADLVLPAAMWVEKEAPMAMPSAARMCGDSSSTRPARRAPISGR